MDANVIKKIIGDLFRTRFETPMPCDVLTFACDTDRSVIIDGKAYSPIIDTIEFALVEQGLKCSSVARIASRLKGDRAFGNVVSPDGAFARALVSKRMKKTFAGKGYPFSVYEKRIWARLLEASEPRAVLGIMPSRELCSACHELGIYVADVQHGVISAEHSWYAGNTRGNEPSEWLPDEFWVWDASTAALLNDWVVAKGSQAVAVGNPWLHFFRNDDANGIRAQLEQAYPIKTKKPLALLTISWGVEKMVRVHEGKAHNGFIPKAVEEAVLATSDIIDWRIRLHPNQLYGFARDEVSRFESYFDDTFGQSSVEWQSVSYLPLPMLLSHTDLHISWSSSVCIEAANFGLRSLIYSPDLLPGSSHPRYYEDLVEDGYVDKIELDAVAIKHWILQNLGVIMEPRETYYLSYQEKLEEIKQLTGR